jgi:hypothetical protein
VPIFSGSAETAALAAAAMREQQRSSQGIFEAVVSTVERFERTKIPYHVLADAVSMGIQVIDNSFITTRTFRDQNRDTLLRFVRAFVEASYWLKTPKNRECALKIVSQRLKTSDPAILSMNYWLYY